MAISFQQYETANRVTSSTVISALVVLALYNCPVLLPSLSAWAHGGNPPIHCTHRPTSLTMQQHNTNTHNPHLADSRGKSLFVYLVMQLCTIVWNRDWIREWGPSAWITMFKSFYSSSRWVENIIPETVLQLQKFPFRAKKKCIIS